MLVKLIEPVIDFALLSKEVKDIVSTLGQNVGQIMCQTAVDGVEDWQTGTGKVSNLPNKLENQYKYIQPSLKNSYISTIIDQYNGFRTRIMMLSSRKCYSVHYDLTPRIHIPIVTNQDCWMIWPYENSCNILEKGNIYWTDTTKYHTFINGGLTERIHLVLCVNK